MPEILWPFETEGLEVGCEHGSGCNLNKVLPTRLKEACEENEFLYDYLHWVPMNDIGVPGYYPKLTRAMRDLDDKNIIYPIKDGLFVHIYPNPVGARDFYVAIEPHMTHNLDHLLEKIEHRLIDWSEEIGESDTNEEKGEVISRALDEILVVISGPSPNRNGGLDENGEPNGNGDNGNGRGGRSRKSDGVLKINVTQREYEAIKYLILRDKVGFGPIAPLLLDPYIEDISCSGKGPIFLEHKIFESVQSTISFPTEDDVDEFVIWMGEWIKRPVTVRNPIVDSVLPDGSRINIVYGTDISKRGSNFTIRKFNETPLSVFELIEFNTLDYMMAAYLSFVLEEDLNMFVVGATASGKTTTLNAITTFMRPNSKIVTIEDTPELQVPHPNWIREMTRGSGREKTGSEVDMFDLLKAALRQRPDRIIIGEIRGAEGAIA
ncbi:MAG: type II/IV secretion system ATPase subunit, partial [Anaerolineales bacterium]|nr:type II/IV secretion system ATPase subunit [Anaerolineales bacterium]